MSIRIDKNENSKVFCRLYQLFCYENGVGVIGEDALYQIPDDVTAYVVKGGNIPCGFVTFPKERCIDTLFLLKNCRTKALIREILTELFDTDVGKWCVPCEFENCVREYTSGNFTKEGNLYFDNSGRSKSDGNLADYTDVQSVIKFYEMNALKHGECLSQRRFADAAKYAAHLFLMRERIRENGQTDEVVGALLDKGGNVTVWTAGLALSAGVMVHKAKEALTPLCNDGFFATSARLILEEYKNL